MTMRMFTYLLVLLVVSPLAFSQATGETAKIFDEAKVAIKAGNVDDLTKHFNEKVDLNFDGEIKTYSQAQAEFVLKDFFKKYPVVDFKYDHIGRSPEGLQYAIGKYTYNGGAFLVYIMIKDFNGKQIIDTLNFHEEDD